MPNIRLKIPVSPPATIGTTKGGHIYVEAPDQSATPAALMDGSTLMDGSATTQGFWAPVDCGKFPYVASQQPWTIEFASGMNQRVSHNIRVYVSSYSDEIDTPLVRYGFPGATPSYVVTIPPTVTKKPGSGSNVTPFLVTGISGSVSAAVSVGGKLRRPIGITVDLSGLPTALPNNWAYQLLGFKDGDLDSDPVLATGIVTDLTPGLVPAGPDGINIAHTFGPEEPTSTMNITIYAVAGLIASEHYVPGGPPHTPGAFQPNNIVQGITASCQVTIGTLTGVVDPTQHIQALLDTSVGVNNALFGVLPLGVDNARIALLAVNTAQLANLAATAAKLAAGSVTAGNGALAANSITAASGAIAALAVGTAAMQFGAITTALIANAAITNALIANLAVGTAQIQNLAVGTAQIANLAVTDAKIASLSVGKLTAGTILVTGTATPAVAVQDSGSSGATTLFAGQLTTKFASGVLGLTLGSGSSDSGITLNDSSGSTRTIQITTFTPGIFINGVQVLSTRVGTAPVTLADVIAVLQHHGLSS